CALSVCVFLSFAWAGRALADFPAPPTYTVGANNPSRCVAGDGYASFVPCEQFSTLAEACNALLLVKNATETSGGAATLAACYDGGTGNNVWGHYYVDQTTPWACYSGDYVLGTAGAAASACPAHSTPTGSGCHCNDGFTELNGSCTGGKNNGCT